MKLSHLAIALILPAATSAYAQTAWVEIGDDAIVAEFELEAGAIDDLDVHGPDGTEIGEIDGVLGAAPDDPSAFVMEVEDEGNLGVRGERVVPIDLFSMEDGRLVLNADAAALREMEQYYGE